MPLLASAASVGPDREGPERIFPALLLAATMLALAACGGLLVYGAGRGIDLTDEIFYLVWARDPEAYRLLYQPFGYLLHPLFRLVHGDLQYYRLAGFAVTAVAGGLVGASLAPDAGARLRFALFGAAAGLTIYFPWIITPSYNSAANVGAMLLVAAVATLPSSRGAARAGVCLALGAGLCIAAFAKPPLFALGVVLTFGLAGWFWSRDRLTAAALLTALLLGGALAGCFLPPWQVPGLIARMAQSQHILALPNTPVRLPVKIALDWLAVPSALSAAAVANLAGLVLWRHRWSRWLGGVGIAATAWYLASTVPDVLDSSIPEFVGISLVLLACGYALVTRPAALRDRLMLLLLLAMPSAVALGTFNNQWAQLDFSMAFPLLALFLLAARDPSRWRSGAAHLFCVLAPATLLLLAARAPYSLPAPIFAQQIPVRHPVTGTPILVDPETADFIRDTAGQAKGALLVDLSGTGPGVAASLGAQAPVLLWLNPATPTWPDVVWSQLDARARRSAWFVTPVWPLFRDTVPAHWFAAHRAHYCATALPEMTFWEQERQLQLWRPCSGAR